MRDLQRHPDCARGTWWWTRGNAGPVVSCPKCQQLHTIPLGPVGGEEPVYTIAIDGSVAPVVICVRCDWSEEIRLLNWTGKPS